MALCLPHLISISSLWIQFVTGDNGHLLHDCKQIDVGRQLTLVNQIGVDTSRRLLYGKTATL